MTLALQGTTTTTDDAVSNAVEQLMDGRPAREAQQVLVVAIAAMGERAADLDRRAKLITELHAFFVQLTTGFSMLNGSKRPERMAKVLLQASAHMAVRLADPLHNNNAFWRAIILSLRAECLHLLDDEAAYAAALTAQASLDMVTPTSAVDERQAFVAELLRRGNPRLTSVTLLDTLHASLPRE